MQPDALARDGGQRLVQRRDVHFGDLQEFGGGLVLEENRALHREVGRVDLQHELARDQLVLLAHLARQREDIGLVAVVVRVQHRRGDDAGRRRRHEGIGRRRRQVVQRRSKHAALFLGRREIVVGDLGDRLRRVRHLAAPGKTLAMLRGKGGEVGVVARPRPRRFAAEAAHALRHVGLEADARLLAVVDDVHAAGDLLARPRGAPPARTAAPAPPRSTVSPASSRISRSLSAGLRGRLPTWVVRIRSSLRRMVQASSRRTHTAALAITAMSLPSGSGTSRPPLTAFTVTMPCGSEARTFSRSTLAGC